MPKQAPKPSPFVTGLKCRCPNCGEGALFRAYLKPVSQCESCGLDMDFADSGDGPAIFIIFIVGFLIIGMAAILDTVLHPPAFVHLMIWLPMTVMLCLLLLPPFKAIMIALQYTNDAKEGRPD